MKLRHVYIQERSDGITWMIPTKRQKNGSYAGIQYTKYHDSGFSGKAKKASFRGYYPEPRLIADGEKVPNQALSKLIQLLIEPDY